jgi:ADP-heptose:LPS heptosyltransferase
MTATSDPRRGLQIYAPRERWLVGVADALLRPLAWWPRPNARREVRRILLLRLERIGDLLMVLDAVQDVRAEWPNAEIDLAVGAWNEAIARLIPGLARVHVVNAPWLARGAAAPWRAVLAHAREWRRRRYDLVLNFEPDIRSNGLAWFARAPVRVGYSSGGGGAFLTQAGPYDSTTHVSVNARRLVLDAARATGSQDGGRARNREHGPLLLPLPRSSVARAETVLADARSPLIGVHVNGGRLSKQWHLDRFAAVARDLAERHRGTIVLTGEVADRQKVDEVRRSLREIPVVDVCGVLDLTDLAALLRCLDVLVTADTGPMHLASAMGTPVVALFGPSNPVRYGPTGAHQRVLRVDLPCSPCGQVRLPPERCRGHVPDCMDAIQVEAVVEAVGDLLLARSRGRSAAPRSE